MIDESKAEFQVLLVDDHPVIRCGLRDFITHAPDISLVGEAEDGEKALRMIPELTPDLILLDIELPGISGIEVAKIIMARENPPHILMFSGHDDFQYVLAIAKLGVSGYVLKDEPPEQILEAIRGVCQNHQKWFSQRIEEQLAHFYRFDREIGLTNREREVFRELALGKTNEEIARKLGISNKTVEKHIEKLFIKLGAVSRTEAAVRGVQAGLI